MIEDPINLANPVQISCIASDLDRVGSLAEYGRLGRRFDHYVTNARLQLRNDPQTDTETRQAAINLRMAINCANMMDDLPRQDRGLAVVTAVFNDLLQRPCMSFMKAVTE